MWMTEFETKLDAKPEDIWKIWQDVHNWKNWDDEVDYSRLQGPFVVGTRGFLKPKGGPKVSFTISHAETHVSFSTYSNLPLCRLNFYHEIKVENGDFVLKHKAEMNGLLSFLFSRIIGKQIQKGMPIAVKKLALLAEQEKRSLNCQN